MVPPPPPAEAQLGEAILHDRVAGQIAALLFLKGDGEPTLLTADFGIAVNEYELGVGEFGSRLLAGRFPA